MSDDMQPHGGKFTGWPDGRFLYSWQLEQDWTLAIDRPCAEFFTGRHFLLTETVSYYHSIQDGLAAVPNSAHPGFVSDGGTIRTVFGWGLVSTPFRDYLPAFLIHDALCQQAKELQHIDLEQAIKLRLYTDRLLYAMMRDLNSGHWRACRTYKAVRAGAFLAGMT